MTEASCQKTICWYLQTTQNMSRPSSAKQSKLANRLTDALLANAVHNPRSSGEKRAANAEAMKDVRATFGRFRRPGGPPPSMLGIDKMLSLVPKNYKDRALVPSAKTIVDRTIHRQTSKATRLSNAAAMKEAHLAFGRHRKSSRPISAPLSRTPKARVSSASRTRTTADHATDRATDRAATIKDPSGRSRRPSSGK